MNHPKSSAQERRRDPRVDSQIPLKISSDQAEIVTQTKNLSRSGAYCRVESYIEPMTKLKIHLLLPFKKEQKTVTKKITCQGVIVRTESVQGSTDYNAAIFFNEISRRDADSIAEFVELLLEHNKLKRIASPN